MGIQFETVAGHASDGDFRWVARLVRQAAPVDYKVSITHKTVKRARMAAHEREGWSRMVVVASAPGRSMAEGVAAAVAQRLGINPALDSAGPGEAPEGLHLVYVLLKC